MNSTSVEKEAVKQKIRDFSLVLAICCYIVIFATWGTIWSVAAAVTSLVAIVTATVI